MKIKLIAIIVAAVMLVGVGTGVGVAIYTNLPQNVAANAVMGAFEELLERDEVKPLYNTLTKGSITASVEGVTQDDVDLLNGITASGKMYFSNKAFMLEDFQLEYDDFKVKGDLYVSEDMLYFSEDEIIQNAYGIKLDEIAKDLEDSIFAFDSGSDYAIPDEETYDMIISMFEDMDYEEMQKDAEKLYKKHFKELWKIACDNFEFESENDEIRIGGEKEKVRVISIVISGDMLASALEDYYDFLCKDDSIVEFLEKYEGVFASYGMDDDMTIVEMYEEILDQFGEELDETCEEIEDSFEDELVIKVITPRSSQKLVKLEVEFDDESVFALELGMKGMKKTDKITLSVAGEKVLTYEVKENTNKAFECSLKAGEVTVKASVDKSKDTYSLQIKKASTSSYYDDSFETTVKGKISTKGDKTTLTVEKITAYDETIKCDITFVIDESDKIPSAPTKFDRISDITEEDIEEWAEKIAEIGAPATSPIG